MKLSVRTKVANGLVIFLLMPRAAETAVNLFDTYSDGLNSFAADDEFEPASGKSNIAGVTVNANPAGDDEARDPSGGDPSGGDPSGGDPSGGDPSGGDPSGGDPSGGDPSGGDPSGGDPSGGDPSGGDPSGGDPACAPGTGAPTLIIRAPTELTTAEDGSSDAFEVFMVPDPLITRFFQIVSTNPDEARPDPETVTLGEDACIPQSIWVIGQNDGVVDGDIDYEIEIRDEQDFVVGTIPGLNIDNDNYVSVAVDVIGPNTLPDGGSGVFLVRATNLSNNLLKGNNLLIEATKGLQITGYAASLLSGQDFNARAKLKTKSLTFQKVDLAAGDVLLVSVDVVLKDGGRDGQKLEAQFYAHPTKQISDDDDTVRTSLP